MPRTLNQPLAEPVFHEPVFNETVRSSDPTGFLTQHASDAALYKQIQEMLKKDVVGFDQSRVAPDEVYALQDALGGHGPEIIKGIKAAQKIVFHSWAIQEPLTRGKYKNEISVADQLTMDAQSSEAANRPAFLFHLGDVVYDFGEAQYYYDQFYNPFRNYPAPIFAIPGNHDSFITPGTAASETPLSIFSRNFCASNPMITPEARSLHRTAMTQPGVYFALDAPFVRIIGLFSNALEDPGVISSEQARNGQRCPTTSWTSFPRN